MNNMIENIFSNIEMIVSFEIDYSLNNFSYI